MSKKAGGSGKGSIPKSKTGKTTETDFKGKYTECNKELNTAKSKISSLETELTKCRFDLLSLETNFNYEKVRSLLPYSMDIDGIQADQNARLMAETSDLRRQLDKQNKNQNHSGSKSTDKKSVDGSDSTLDRNKIPTLEREKAALEREKAELKRDKNALENKNGSLDKEVKEFKIELASFSKLKDENNKLLQTIEDLNKQLKRFKDENRDLKAQTQEEPRQKSELISKKDEHIQALTSQANKISELKKNKEKLEKQLDQSQDDFKRLKSEKDAHVCKKDERNESTNVKNRNDLEKDMNQLQEQLKECRDERDRLKKEIEVYTSTEEDNSPGFDQIREKESSESKDLIIKFRKEIDNINQANKDEKDKYERESKDQLNKLKKECDDIKQARDEKEKAQRESKDQIKELKKEIDDIKQASNDEKEKKQRNLGDLKAKLDSTNVEIDELKGKLKEERERLKAQTEQNKGNATEVEKELRKEIENLKTRLKDQAQRKHGNSRENELIEEIEKLKSRLSQMAGAQLMTNNPNIADLSDVNRPTKIAEQYTELYDNEWTNVFEILENVGDSEPKIVDTLYKMLVDSFRYCEEKSVEQTKQLKLSLTSVQKKGDVISDDKIVPTKLRQLRELRKAFAPDMIESIFEAYTKDKKPKHINRPEMKEFVHKCITLCWFMAVQDPPVVIDTKNHTGTFNGDLFRTYTTTGKKIAFIVWPPLYLHDGGPMLSKGIAQGK